MQVAAMVFMYSSQPAVSCIRFYMPEDV